MIFIDENDDNFDPEPYFLAREQYEKIIYELYITGNVEKFERWLEDLGACFNINIPQIPIKIRGEND